METFAPMLLHRVMVVKKKKTARVEAVVLEEENLHKLIGKDTT